MKLLPLAFLVPVLYSAPMPLPWKSVPAAGHLVVDSSFAIEIHGFTDPRIDSAVRRFTERISRQTGIPIVGGKTALVVEHSTAALVRRILCAGYLAGERAILGASTVEGALHGLETFAQLIQPGADGI